jgi:hypothetical protein
VYFVQFKIPIKGLAAYTGHTTASISLCKLQTTLGTGYHIFDGSFLSLILLTCLAIVKADNMASKAMLYFAACGETFWKLSQIGSVQTRLSFRFKALEVREGQKKKKKKELKTDQKKLKRRKKKKRKKAGEVEPIYACLISYMHMCGRTIDARIDSMAAHGAPALSPALRGHSSNSSFNLLMKSIAEIFPSK